MIKAEIIADSYSMTNGKRLTTFCIEYPRFILAEVNTHRMLSKNSFSSRAVPISKVIDKIRDEPARPVHWGKNQAGMQAKEELEPWAKINAIVAWDGASDLAMRSAEHLSNLGVHKQVANRLLEPFQIMKTVITGTEWENFFALRAHPDAQPEFQELAYKMESLYLNHEPFALFPGEWHLPYYESGYWAEDHEMSLEDARMISVSCCAQVSYRTTDDSIEKARKVFSMLNLGSETDPVHASPTEHQGTPMQEDAFFDIEGVTAIHRELGPMSGNLAGWIQYRQLIKNNTKW